MSDAADRFAEEAPGVEGATSVREGAYIHEYRGTVAAAEERVRLLTLAPHIDDEAVQDAFERAAGQWHNPSTHPNIISVHDRNTTPRPWIAVADPEGQPLDALQAHLSVSDVRTIIKDVAEALRNAALYNTTHLALTPEDIWVVNTDDGRQARVDGWGLERACRVAAGERPLSPFTAPELVEDPAGGTEKTDVYGLGAIAYYALTGQPPITDTGDLAGAIEAGNITPPSDCSSAVPEAADEVVLTALACRPADRQSSSYEFKTAITNALPTSQTTGVDPEKSDQSPTEQPKTAEVDDNQSGSQRWASREEKANNTSGSLTAIPGISESLAATLSEAGYTTLGDIEDASPEELESVDGVSRALAERLKDNPTPSSQRTDSTRSLLPRRAVLGILGAGIVGGVGYYLSQTNSQQPSTPSESSTNPTPGSLTQTPESRAGTNRTPTETTTDNAGADSSSQTSSQTRRTARVGILMPTSGGLGNLGQLIQQGGVLAAEQLQNADIPIDVDYQTEDTQTSPSAGVSAAQALVDAGYPAIMGPASSGVNLAVSGQVYIPNQVVGCSPSSTSPDVTTLDDNDFIFRTAPSDALQGRVLARIAVDRVDSSSASTLFVNNDYGQALSESFTSAFRNRGGTVNTQVAFDRQQPSYSSVLSEALGSDPDTLMVIGYPVSGRNILQDYYSSYSDGDYTLLLSDGLADDSLPDDVGNDLSNVLGSTPQASGPARQAFDQMYQDAYDRSPGVFNAHAYDAVAVLLLANAWAGENSGPAVRDSMRDVANPDGTEITAENLPEGIRMAVNNEPINYSGASSLVNFDENGDMRAVTYGVWEFGDDGITVTDSIETNT